MSSDSVPNPPESGPVHGESVSVGRLVAWAILAFVLFGAGIVCFGFYDGVGFLMKLMRPRLVPARGTIMIGDEPLTQGHLMTKPSSGSATGSIGLLESDGNFVLKTDVDGSYVDGAYVGTHKVIINAQQSGSFGAAAPPSAVSSKFTSFETTPLTIDVSSDPAKNVFALVAEKNAPAANPNSENAESRNSDQSAAPSSPTRLVLQQRLPGVDADGDGRYTRDEFVNAKSPLTNKFIDFDADKNGFLEGSELESLVEAVPAAPDGK